MAAYTSIPSLSSYHLQAILSPLQQPSQEISDLHPPAEVLLFAWAGVLESLSGTPEVVFWFDEQPICVNTALHTWHTLNDEHSGGKDTRGTAVFPAQTSGRLEGGIARAHRKRPEKWLLQLQCSGVPEKWRLSSAFRISKHALDDICARLSQQIQKFQRNGIYRPLDLEIPEMPLPLSILNPRPQRIAGARPLHQLIDFESHAHKTAIEYLRPDGRLVEISFAKLDELSNRLAFRILTASQDVGNARIGIVPILIPQSPDLYIAQLAILKAGGAFCPLNLDAPDERIDLILEDVAARILVTNRAMEAQASHAARRTQILFIDDIQSDHADAQDVALDVNLHGSLAYIMYTSGSTGTPKGVPISHEAASQALLAHDEHIPNFKRFLQFAAPTFDVSVFEIFFPLIRGSTLVCCAREVMLSDLGRTLNRLEIDAAELTPTVAGTLLKTRDSAPSLKLLLTIGEMLTEPLIREFGFYDNEEGILYGMYGPTEATIHCTLVPKFDRNLRIGIIGKPLSTVSAFVLSIPQNESTSKNETKILPIGTVGELAIGGYQLAERYLNRTEQTAAAFVNLPGYGRVYRTGDKARMNLDGQLECLGRISSGQVKLRGQRVELGEIEQVAYKIESIHHAIASVLEGVLVLFCLVSESSVSVRDIQHTYKRSLPGFMRPNEIVILTEAPKLASGKIDRKQLEQSFLSRRRRPDVTESCFKNATERSVAETFMEQLGTSITRLQNLANLGLDSLRAIRIASRLRSQNLEISVADLLSADNIATIAETVESQANAHDAPQATTCHRSLDRSLQRWLQQQNLEPDIVQALPCSEMQLGMLAETARLGPINFNQIGLAFSRETSFVEFRNAFQQVAKVNNILRSGYSLADIHGHPFVRLVRTRLDDTQFAPILPSKSQLGQALGSMSISRPLKLFVSEKEKRVLVLIHHASYDQWSWDIIMGDLNAILHGTELPQRPQFDAVTTYSRSLPGTQEWQDAEDYWREHLLDAPRCILSCLRTQRPHGHDRGAISVVSDVSVGCLREVCQKLNVSLHSLISGAFSLLLSSYYGTADVVFGTVSSGRSLPIQGIDQIIGPCISTLPLRIDVSRVRTVRDLVTNHHSLFRQIIRHGILPLQKIQNLAAIPGHSKLFDAIFVWQESLAKEVNNKAILTTVDASDYLDYSLTLEAEPTNEQINLKASFLLSVFPDAQIQFLLSQLNYIVRSFAEFPYADLKNVYNNLPPHLLSIENSQFQNVIQEDAPFTGVNGNIVRAKNRLQDAWQIDIREPRKTAIEFVEDFDAISGSIRSKTVTFQELHDGSAGVACALASRGVRPGDLVGIYLQKCVELYIFILGILKSGAGYFPLDLKTPPERARHIFEEASVTCLVTTEQLKATFGETNLDNVLFVGRGIPLPKPVSGIKLPREVKGSSIAYAISTSGTTGAPKTVLVSRSNIRSNLAILSEMYPTLSTSRLLQSCSHAFDVSAFDILFSFQNGICLCSAANDILFRDPQGFIQKLQITHLSMTSSVASMLVATKLPTVKCLITAGEAVSSKVHNAWAGRGLFQGYGPSETTNICSLRPDSQQDVFPNNIGHPLINTSMFISASDELRPLPRGAIGEICVGGQQVCNGYLNRPHLMQKFVDHHQWGRVYRTGDIGRLLSDGSFCIYGREDDQVKMRGQRIELGEIDNAVLQLEGVHDCTTLVIENPNTKSTNLVTFWTVKGVFKATLSAEAIRKKLSTVLPAHMVPDDLVLLEDIPLTTQRKIDRKALHEAYFRVIASGDVDRQLPGSSLDERDPLSELQSSLAAMVLEITGGPIRKLSQTTSFFRLGLDSISSIHLSTRIRNRLHCQVDVSTILRYNTLETLAEAVQAKLDSSNNMNGFIDHGACSQLHVLAVPEAKSAIPTPMLPFDADFLRFVEAEYLKIGLTASAILPCTPLQESMLSSSIGSVSQAYWNRIELKILVDESVMTKAWEIAVKRHDILRTGFMATENSKYPFAQVVLADFALPVTGSKSTGTLQKPESNIEMCKLPPYHISFARECEPSGTKMVLDIHHALYDAEALSILLQDVEMIVTGKERGSISLFQDYVRYMMTLEQESTDIFWKRQLHNFKPAAFTFEVDHRLSLQAELKQQHILRQPGICLSRIDETAKLCDVTRLSICQAAWARLIALRTGATDICFGNVYSGRSLPIERVATIVGPCFNTLPVRARFPGLKTNAELARSLHAINTAILPMQPSSLRRIQSNHKTNKPLFDTLLLLQNEEIVLDSTIWSLVEDSGDMAFPLIIELCPDARQDSLTVMMHWSENLMTELEAEEVLDCFEIILQDVCGYPSSQAIDSTLLTDQTPSFFAKIPQQDQERSRENSLDRLDSANSTKWRKEELDVREVISNLAEISHESVRRSSTIFNFGLDSINAFQIANKLKESGYSVSAGEVLEAGSVSDIANLLCQANSSAEHNYMFDFDSFQRSHLRQVTETLRVDTRHVEALRPCTSVQCGIISAFLQSHGAIYLNHIVMMLDPAANLERLQRAWTTVTATHELLRTGFVHHGDAKRPFAMLTYRACWLQLPWYVSTKFSDINTIERNTYENLHLPPWRLEIVASSQQIKVQLSILHALYDATALDTILNDVAASYHGAEIAESGSLPLTISAVLEAEIGANDKSQDFWREYVACLTPTKFPNLRFDTRKEQGFGVASKLCSMSHNALSMACKKLGVSLQATAQAAWARLLSSFLGEQQVTFGIVLSGRTAENSGSHNVVFPCINTLPLGANIGQRNRDLLEMMSARTASLIRHQSTPLAKVKQVLQIESDVFDTVFVYQRSLRQTSEPSYPWHTVSEQSSAEYSVSLEFIPKANDCLELRLTFMNSVLPQSQADIILSQLDELIADSVRSPERQARDFSILSPRLCSSLNAKQAQIESPVKLLHQFVERSALENPGKTALEFAYSFNQGDTRKRTWTYRQLDEEGNAVAHLLLRRGVVQGSLVGVCFDKCPEASFAILGILKAGCAYVPIDPAAPPARKQFLLQDATCTALLTTNVNVKDLSALNPHGLIAIDEVGLLSGLPRTYPILERPASEGDLCYCLFTSGSTGTPKGCEITHRNAVQAMMAFQRLFAGHWDHSSRWLQFASFHFDVSVLEQYWSWSVGICVVSAPRDLLLEDLSAAIQTLQITHIDLTPSLARLITPEDASSLRKGVFITGGEQLRQEIIDTWGDERVVYNGYGPTEVTIGCTMLPRISRYTKASNIGPQFDNVGSLVLQAGTQSIVPRGGIGELCLSGPLVGRGYRNRHELTRQKFEFLERLGERFYRTGDLVRLLHDNSFDFVGRLDDQVKLRGQRLEVGEINYTIQDANEEAQEVFTSVFRHPKQTSDQLVSFVAIAHAQSKVQEISLIADEMHARLRRTLHKACREHLPAYMVPTSILLVDRLPLSANNKIDRKRLQKWYDSLSTEEIQIGAQVQTSSQKDSLTMTRIMQTFGALFDTSEPNKITPSTSFFELGLDSISAIGFARALRRNGFHVQPSTIMRYCTAQSLSAIVEDSSITSDHVRSLQHSVQQNMLAFHHRHLPSVAEKLGRNVEDIQALAPCTPLQEGMIYRTLASMGSLYFSLFTFELNDSVDVDKLRIAWSRVQCQNDILRTHFTLTDDGYAQAVLTKDEKVHISAVEMEDNEDLWRSIRGRHARWCNDMTNMVECLWNVWIAKCSRQRVMCLSMFHALYDGISLSVILENVAREYLNQPSLTSQLTFHQALYRGPLRRTGGENEFWTNALSDPESLGLLQEQAKLLNTLSMSKHNIDSEYVHSLRTSLGVTEPAIFQACWLLTLQKHFGTMPTIGIVVSGRSDEIEGTADAIGPMFNTLPFQIKDTNNCSISGLIQKCHEFNIASLPYQHTPLRDIAKWTRGLSNGPLFDSLFVFSRERPEEEICKKLWSTAESESATEYPLAIEVQRNRDGSLFVTVLAIETFLKASKLEQLASDLESFIALAASDPTKDIKANGNQQRRSSQDSKNTGFVPRVERFSKFEGNDQAEYVRKTIATLAEVDIRDVQYNTSILKLGLDSIDAIKLSARLRGAGIAIAVSEVMQCQTVTRMMDKIASSQKHNTPPGTDTISMGLKQQLEGPIRNQGLELDSYELLLPATSLQEGMIAQMLSSGFAEYYNHDVLELSPNTREDRVYNAWNAVVHEHAILRTNFIAIEDAQSPFSFAQAVLPATNVEWKPIQIHQATELPGVIQSIREEARQAGLKAQMLRLTPVHCGSKAFLIVTAAHAIFDGWSMSLILGDVAKHYAGQSLVSRPPYAEVVWQILQAHSPQNSSFWRGQLSSATPTLVPVAGKSGNLLHRAEARSAFSADEIYKFCRAQSVTFQTLGILCWSMVLAWRTRQLDVCFGLVLSGRNFEGSEDIVFPMMNSVPFRTILHGNRSQMLKYIQEFSSKVASAQHFPMREAMKLAGRRSDALFNTLFISQKQPPANSQLPELYRSVSGSSATEFPVNIEMEIVSEEVVWRIACQDHAFDQKGTEELLQYVEAVLAAVIKQPEEEVFFESGGKIRLSGLPAFTSPDISRGSASASSSQGHAAGAVSTSEWTPLEVVLRSSLSQVTATPENEITKETSLFQLGLDSINAMKLSLVLSKKSLRLSVSDMLRAVTVEKMAAKIQPRSDLIQDHSWERLPEMLEGLDKDEILSRCNVLPANVEFMFPATAFQSYALIMSQKSDGTLFYPSFSFRLSHDVPPTKLEAAWRSLLDKLPILRTLFVQTGSRNCPFVQVILRKTQNHIHWANQALNGPRLTRKQMPMVKLFVNPKRKCISITLKIHHALYDAVSFSEIVGIFQELCNTPEDIAIPNTDFGRYLALTSALMPYQKEHQQEFWSSYLRDAKSHPPKNVRAIAKTKRIELFRPCLIHNITGLEETARHNSLSIQAVFIAAFSRAYYRRIYSCGSHLVSASDSELIVGVYLANRSHDIERLDRLAAPTVNIVPLRIKIGPVSSGNSLDEILEIGRHVQRDLSEIGRAEHCGVALHEILAWTGVRLDCCLNFLKLPKPETSSEENGQRPRKDEISLLRKEPEQDDLAEELAAKDVRSILIKDADVADAYLPALDVEASVSADGLDVGLFDSRGVLNGGDVRMMMESLKTDLLRMVQLD